MVISGSNMVLDALQVDGRLSVVVLAKDIAAGVGDKIIASAKVKGISCLRNNFV